MKIISIYECDHCTQYLKTRKSIENHEKICFQNPDSCSCATCFFSETINVARGYCLKLATKENEPSLKLSAICIRII